MTLQRTLLAGLGVVIALAPLPFGSVVTWARACLTAACIGLGIIWVLWRRRRGLAPFPLKDPVLLAGALFAMVGVLQVIPLPRSVLQGLSPRAVEIRDRYEAPAEPLEFVREGATTPFEGARPVSLDPWSTRRATLMFLGNLLVVLITIDLAGQRRARRILMGALIAAGAFQAIYGLAEYVTARQHIFGYTKKFYTDVATGTFINRNHFAGYLAMTLPLVLAVSCEFATRLWGKGGETRPTTLSRATGRELFIASALLVLALAMATALACSRSRMGIFSACLSIVAVGSLMTWRSRRRVPAIAGILLAVGTMTILAQGQVGTWVVERFLALPAALDTHVGRWQVWSQTLDMASEFPLLGIGWGAYANVFRMFRTSGQGQAIDHAENDYLQLFTEIGLLGGLLAIAGVLIIILPILRKRAVRPDYGFAGYGATAGVIAISLHSLIDSNLAIPCTALTFSVLVGLVISWWRIPPPALASNRAGSAPRRLGSVISVIGLGAIALLALAPAVPDPVRPPPRRQPGAREGNASRDLGMIVDGSNPKRLLKWAGFVGIDARNDFGALVEARPWESYSEEIVIYIENRLADATKLAARSVRQLPTSSSAHVALAELRISQCATRSLSGDNAETCVLRAIPHLWAALEVDPMSARTHAKAARVLIATWSSLDEHTRTRSGEIIERAINLNRGNQFLKDSAASLEIWRERS